jgi:hypothetical protein
MRLSATRTAKICPIEIAANISPCVTGKMAQLHVLPHSPNYSVDFPAFFALAHLVLIAAESAALAAAENFFLGF